MGLTHLPVNSEQAVVAQSVGLFASCLQRTTIIGRLTGKMPSQKAAEKNLRVQSSSYMPIVRAMDLSRTAGEKVTFDLINLVKGAPIMGSDVAEGKGEAMTMDQDELYINQTRKPISAGGKMTQQRTLHDLRGIARAQADGYMKRLEDQLVLVHAAGARGFANDIEWVIPLASAENFAAVCVNPVKAPTYNRHFISTGSSISHVAAANNEITLESTDIMNTDVIDAIRAHLDEMPLPPPYVEFPGDEAASDDPIRVLLVSAQQYNQIMQSNQFRTFQANAYQRAAVAGNHPIFKGEAALWNGILIKKMPKPIRFNSGDPIKWCASATSVTETATDLVPAAFGTSFAVDRAILLGGQAIAEAYGKNIHTGNPYFWNEEQLDHKDKLEVLIGMISGKSKIRFSIDMGDQTEITDHGVMVFDTVVPRVN